MEYLIPYLICSPFLMLNGVVIGMLRAEGEARRSSALSIFASLINIIMDPILIYTLDLGLFGAAWATCLSFIITTVIGLWWYLRGKMFIKPTFKNFRFNKEQIWDICRVGVPHSLELAVIPMLMMPQNSLVVAVGGTDGMITYSLPYRYISLAMVPAQAIAAAMIPVASYSIGRGDRDNVVFCFKYSAKLIAIISIVLTAILIILADPFAWAFTYSDDMVKFRDEIAMVIRIYALVLITITGIHLCSSILQTLCYSQLATVTMFIREIIFLVLFYISTFFDMTAIYWSLDIAETAGALLMVACVLYALKKTVPKSGIVMERFSEIT
jgi:Na+-driven multidrug efflux pump